METAQSNSIVNIAERIIHVMKNVKSISKSGYNSFHKYKYVTDAAIVAEIRKEMIKEGLVCIPNHISCVTNNDLTSLLVEYTLIDSLTGEKIVSRVYGFGQDKGDKGVYKAATGAEKYYLLKTFLLPTDDDPEKDSTEKKRFESKVTQPSLTSESTEIVTVSFIPERVEHVQAKKSGNWYHNIYDPDGAKYMCFEVGMAAQAQEAAKENKMITLEYKREKWGLQVVSLFFTETANA